MHRLKISALLLAAGSSSRYGSENKLLTLYRGKPLLMHSAELITGMNDFERVVAITGYDKDAIEASLEPFDIECFYNDKYQTGLASSVKLGISNLADNDAILVFPADMPNIKPHVIDRLLASLETELDKSATKGALNSRSSVAIVVPTRAGMRGNPVLLLNRCFPSAMTMNGDKGARQLFTAFENEIIDVEVDCDGIHQDIDRPADIR